MSLDFEDKIYELEKQIHSLKKDGVIAEDIIALEERLKIMIERIYKNITPWQRVLIARHQDRPKLTQYLTLFEDLFELKGDRRLKNDNAVYTGIGLFRGMPVAVMGHNKGCTMEEKVQNHFGMSNPAGYYKAIRLLKFANSFSLPVISFIDTPGAAAGLESEEQGQFVAIAECMSTALSIKSNIIAVLIGEGGSGGAVAFATANKIFMLENAIYSVISPEGCSSILWKSAEYKMQAAEVLKLSAQDLLNIHMIDGIIPEPTGGAHRNHHAILATVADTLWNELNTMLPEKRFITI